MKLLTVSSSSILNLRGSSDPSKLSKNLSALLEPMTSFSDSFSRMASCWACKALKWTRRAEKSMSLGFLLPTPDFFAFFGVALVKKYNFQIWFFFQVRWKWFKLTMEFFPEVGLSIYHLSNYRQQFGASNSWGQIRLWPNRHCFRDPKAHISRMKKFLQYKIWMYPEFKKFPFLPITWFQYLNKSI